MKKVWWLAVLAGLCACTTTTGGAGKRAGQGACCLVATPRSGGATLTAGERAGLEHMREEEKLARDVYLALEAAWGIPVFGNIARRAEETHMAAMASLLEAYDVPDPARGLKQGAFRSAERQKLHDRLRARGETSLEAALQVGVEIEELDIADLQRYAAQTERGDIRTVYANLEKASRNHLRAFMGHVEGRGGSYAPKHLSRAEFKRILESPHERGPAGTAAGGGGGGHGGGPPWMRGGGRAGNSGS